jgi:GMP synthase (glutamine-hydrolysing)
MTETVAIIDFGSQFTQLIARRIRESNVFSEIFRPGVRREELLKRPLKGIILSGGPKSVYDKDAPRWDSRILSAGVPVLGICYGMQLVCHELGGRVTPSKNREYGRTRIVVRDHDHLFEGVPESSTVWMSHGDVVDTVTQDWRKLAQTDYQLLCAVRHKSRPIYAVQFHPEVAHTEHGATILRNFVQKICGCRGDWRVESFAEAEIARIRQTVGRDRVICGLSGGVDSTVVATLVHRAVGGKLTCVFVDNGLLRLDEAESMVKMFREDLKLNVRAVDAEARFLKKLKGVREPERKRRIIGHEFIEVFSEEARKLKGAKYLAQGTLYPDLIESRSAFGGPTSKIKTHHNVGGLPKDLKFTLIEPLKLLFKDEVRRIAQALGISERFWRRQPFPGPGLAVRVVGEISKEKLQTLRRADNIVREEVEKAQAHPSLWQYFAVILPVRSVGVMGDARTYQNVIAIRAVESQDGMTADWARLPHAVLERISSRITNEVKGVNRVVYDISSKPPSTIEWE